MQRMDPAIVTYYDKEVIKMMCDKYGYSEQDALKEFVCSETHSMLEYEDYGLTAFGPGAILELWEAEKITGDPRNSIYIRED